VTYLEQLQKAHQIEVGGEAAYVAAARWTWNQQRRAKWVTLAKLETQTKGRISRAIAAAGGTANERGIDALIGFAAGGLLACLPWKIALRLVRPIIVHALSFWAALARDYPNGDAPLHEYLVAHEQAQLEFVQEELSGDPDGSLRHVSRLLTSRAHPLQKSE
jgi:hypothetical protein